MQFTVDHCGEAPEPYNCDRCFYAEKLDAKQDEIDELKELLKEASRHIDRLCHYISNAASDGSVWTDVLAEESDILDCKIRRVLK